MPGGPLQPDEDLAASARHTLERTTGLTSSYLEQLYSFGTVERSPQRVVSIVYWALVRSDEVARAVDGENVEWFVADEIPELAFDHNGIVQYALNRLRAKITYSPIARFFLRPEFALAELRAVHEAVLRKRIDPANFRRQALATKTLVPTGNRLTGTSHRPPALSIRLRQAGPFEVALRAPERCSPMTIRRPSSVNDVITAARARAVTPIWRADRGTSTWPPATAPVPPSWTSSPSRSPARGSCRRRTSG